MIPHMKPKEKALKIVPADFSLGTLLYPKPHITLFGRGGWGSGGLTIMNRVLGDVLADAFLYEPSFHSILPLDVHNWSLFFPPRPFKP